MRTRAVVLAGLLLTGLPAAGSVASAQRRGGGMSAACRFSWDNENYFISPFFAGTPVYDGRVTFARIKYKGAYECGGEGPGWSHDYPRTESHFMRIMKEITSMRPFIERGPIIGSAIVRLDQPEMFKYPIAYLSEPGGWNMNDAELQGLKRYIERGGFIIFDDIEGAPNPDYLNLLAQWHRVFPRSVPVRLTNDHPIFNCFFGVDLSKIPSKMRRVPAEYLGIFEDNDPKKRMVAIIDNYADIGEFIEWSDEGFNVVPANEAYKLWVNYFVYALTH
ncbi:MAG TPA: DUF4159 domain-containing protein [Gemmatimonadaceae bacterium]|nr:DUF4159 domain-containing protein [Gemmatimonadaceae bacterium]